MLMLTNILIAPSNVFTPPIAFAILALVLGAGAMFSRSLPVRAACYCTALLATLALGWYSLSLPQPSWLGTPPGRLVSYSLDEPVAIYVWIQPKGSSTPQAFMLPWDKSRAIEIRNAEAQAKEQGMDVMARGSLPGRSKKHGSGLRGIPMFYPAPPPPLPEKTRP